MKMNGLETHLLESRVRGEVDVLEVLVVVVAAQRSLFVAGRLKLVQCVCLLKLWYIYSTENRIYSGNTIMH